LEKPAEARRVSLTTYQERPPWAKVPDRGDAS
jgi:hypothetical protein